MGKLLFNRYMKIDGLGSGWHDAVELLLRAPFQILVDFVEKEHPGDVINWDATPEHSHAWDETMVLYTWWTILRPRRHDPIDDLPIPPFHTEPCEDEPGFLRYIPATEEEAPGWQAACEESSRLEQLWEDEDQSMLHRLIDIRGFLWT